jgi:hypothetical protein
VRRASFDSQDSDEPVTIMATGGDRDSIHSATTVRMDSNTRAILDAMQKQHERVQDQVNSLTRLMDEKARSELEN